MELLNFGLQFLNLRIPVQHSAQSIGTLWIISAAKDPLMKKPETLNHPPTNTAQVRIPEGQIYPDLFYMCDHNVHVSVQ